MCRNGRAAAEEDADKIRALLVGPGLAHAPGTDDFVLAVLRNAKTVTTVIDADGLNALARTEGWTEGLPPRTILTQIEKVEPVACVNDVRIRNGALVETSARTQ